MIQVPKAFEKVNPENMVGIIESNQIILRSVFYKLNSKDQNALHFVVLTQKFILYYHDSTKTKIKRLIKIDFNCKFQMIKNNAHQKVGIRFQREGCKSYDLMIYQGDSIEMWEIQLQKRMNKGGIQEEFKALKKITTNNFGTVYLAIRNNDNMKVAVKLFLNSVYLNKKKVEIPQSIKQNYLELLIIKIQFTQKMFTNQRTYYISHQNIQKEVHCWI